MQVVHLIFACFSMLGVTIRPMLIHYIIIMIIIKAKEPWENEMRLKSCGPMWNVVRMKTGLR
mgnify:CR=1 FL=1